MRKLSPALFAVAALSFLLPFVTLSCVEEPSGDILPGGMGVITVSGVDLARVALEVPAKVHAPAVTPDVEDIPADVRPGPVAAHEAVLDPLLAPAPLAAQRRSARGSGRFAWKLFG